MPQGERRLAAIMFTDMVGYTSLGQRNESLSLALVEEQRKLVRPVVSRHNGREVKTIGDAFLVEFPNALDAVRCAYDIQRAVREFNISLPEGERFQLRIGIHLGDVVVSEGDISGDSVNVASRIEPLAEAGGVCLTGAVYNLVSNKLDLAMESVGTRTLKNVASPVEVYKIVMPWQAPQQAVAEPLDRRRVAVLPFANMSPNAEDEYFADGITEELISTVSRVRGLRVIARTTAMYYKGRTKRASEIGTELKVGTILEGSVRKSGDRVRITAQLIDAPSEEHVWADDYERRLEDVFQIQKEIAGRIADELKVKLLPEERSVIDRLDTKSPSAHVLYLKGRHFWNERSRRGLEEAKKCFEEAVELDPAYARAYSGLADTYSIMAFQNVGDVKDDLSKSRAFARRALEFDDTLAEAHTSLAFNLEGDWERSEAEYQTALRLNPSYATAHFWFSIQLLWRGRNEEAIAHARQAEELDPLSPATSIALGQVLMYSGRYDEAIEHLEAKVKSAPEAVSPRFVLGMACLYKGLYERAAEEERKALSIEPEYLRAEAVLGVALARLGMKGEARDVLEHMHKAGGQKSILAMLHLELGERERALELLAQAYDDDSSVAWVSVVPSFDPVRSDPRFQELMKKLGLPATR